MGAASGDKFVAQVPQPAERGGQDGQADRLESRHAGFFEGPTKWDLAFHGDAWCDELAELSKEFGEKAGLLVFDVAP